MQYKINYGSWYELDYPHEDLAVNSGSNPDYLSSWAKKMTENDPNGSKADEIAKKYRILMDTKKNT